MTNPKEIKTHKIESIQIVKPVAFQIIFGSILMVVLTVVTLTMELKIGVLISVIAYFPYIYTKTTTEPIIQKILWVIYFIMIGIAFS
jgi:hypothetical protein